MEYNNFKQANYLNMSQKGTFKISKQKGDQSE